MIYGTEIVVVFHQNTCQLVWYQIVVVNSRKTSNCQEANTLAIHKTQSKPVQFGSDPGKPSHELFTMNSKTRPTTISFTAISYVRWNLLGEWKDCLDPLLDRSSVGPLFKTGNSGDRLRLLLRFSIVTATVGEVFDVDVVIGVFSSGNANMTSCSGAWFTACKTERTRYAHFLRQRQLRFTFQPPDILDCQPIIFVLPTPRLSVSTEHCFPHRWRQKVVIIWQ